MKSTARNGLFVGLSFGLLLCLALCYGMLPGRAFSPMENRQLAQIPQLSKETVRSGRWMGEAERYLADQIAGRDQWMLAQAVGDRLFFRRERNDIVFGSGDRLFEACAFWDTQLLSENIRTLDQLAAFDGRDTAVMLIPASAAIHPESLPAGYPAEDQWALITTLSGHLETARPVDLFSALDTYTGPSPRYYRTDHHWTAEGAKTAYEALADFYGFSLARETPERYEEPAFYGAYYARAPSPWIPPDTFSVDIFSNVALEVEGQVMPGLLDPQQVAQRDKYAAVLYGNHGRKILRNPAASGGGLLVLQDSYANALLPWLAQHFSPIEAIDLRYFTGDLAQYIEETEAEQILCIYGLSTLLTDRNLLLQSVSWSS